MANLIFCHFNAIIQGKGEAIEYYGIAEYQHSNTFRFPVDDRESFPGLKSRKENDQ